jgi:hypothetical protein
MKMTVTQLKELNPCEDGLDFVHSCRSLAVAWEKCERADWMIWLLRRLEKMPKEVSITFARFCADSAKNHAASAASTRAYDAARCTAYACTASTAAAFAAANASDTAYAAAANTAAAYAADTAEYAASAAAAARIAAYYAADADAVAARAARAAERKKQANFLRTLMPNPFKVTSPHLRPAKKV